MLSYCPECAAAVESKVVDSRPWTLPDGVETTRRRRKCEKAGHRWSTVEIDVDRMESLEPIDADPYDRALRYLRRAYRLLDPAQPIKRLRVELTEAEPDSPTTEESKS